MNFLDKKNVQIIIIVLVLIFSLYKTLKNKNKSEELIKNGLYTTATIVGHDVSGIHENFYIEYTYKIDNKSFTKFINYRDKFRDCYETRKCIGLKFRIYYNPENLEETFIDFNYEM